MLADVIKLVNISKHAMITTQGLKILNYVDMGVGVWIGVRVRGGVFGSH